MKHCAHCNQSKTFAEYYATTSGGYMHICKDCHKAAMKHNRLTNPRVQQYDRERAKLPDRKANSRRISAQWRADHPEAYKAQTAVGNALRDGKLSRLPCALCGATKNVHAHHSDYSKPLDVKWLCAKCHHRVHATFPQLQGHGASA